MKKIILLFTIMLVAAGAFAQVSIGVDGGLMAHSISQTQTLGLDTQEIVIGLPLASAGFYVDADFVSAGVSYLVAAGNPVVRGYLNGEEVGSPLESTLHFDFVAVDLIGKYPIRLGKVITLFPGIGIKYITIMKATQDGVDQEITQEAKDYWTDILVGGVAGIDINISDNLYFRALGRVDFNLNAAPDKPDPDVTYTGTSAAINIGLGIRL